MHGRPPAPRHPRVADLGAAQHPHAQVHPPLGDQAQALVEALAPGLAQAHPVVGRAAQRLGELLGRRLVVRRPAGGALAHAQLVPLDLEGDERRDQVVDVGGARRHDGERAVAAVVPAPAAGGGVDLLPLLDREPVAGEHLRLLAHDHEVGSDDPVGQAPDRVDERAQVRLVAGGERVEARAHRPVRRLEHAQRGLAGRAQQRVVGALVELDLVAQAPSGRLLCGCECDSGNDHDYSLTYGMPIDAGGRDRPIRPATTTSTSTYGSAWNSTASDSEKAGSRCATALEKPNSKAPASAP